MNLLYIVIWLTVSCPSQFIQNDQIFLNRWGHNTDQESDVSFNLQIFDDVDSIEKMNCYQHDPRCDIKRPYKIFMLIEDYNAGLQKNKVIKVNGDFLIFNPYESIKEFLPTPCSTYIFHLKKSNTLREMIVQPFYNYTYDTTWSKNDSGKFIFKEQKENKNFKGYKMYPLSDYSKDTLYLKWLKSYLEYRRAKELESDLIDTISWEVKQETLYVRPCNIRDSIQIGRYILFDTLRCDTLMPFHKVKPKTKKKK
jgi:hypothetical protein